MVRATPDPHSQTLPLTSLSSCVDKKELRHHPIPGLLKPFRSRTRIRNVPDTCLALCSSPRALPCLLPFPSPTTAASPTQQIATSVLHTGVNKSAGADTLGPGAHCLEELCSNFFQGIVLIWPFTQTKLTINCQAKTCYSFSFGHKSNVWQKQTNKHH